jgi:PAS domain S-box-containing protein
MMHSVQANTIFHTTFDQMPIGIAYVSLEGKWLHANPRLCEVLLYSQQELEHHPYLDLTFAEDRDKDRTYLQRFLAREITSASFEKRFRRKDGIIIWTRMSVSLVLDPMGSPAYFAAIIDDIETRKQKEEHQIALYTHEAQAREQAEDSNEQLQILQTITDHALAHLSLDDLFRSVLRRIREIMDADNIAILLLNEDRTHLTVRAVDGIEEAAASTVRIPMGKGFAGTVAARCQPIIAGKQEPVEILTPILREQLYTLLGVPLVVDGRVLGVIHIGTKQQRTFSQETIDLFERVADRLALAIERSLFVEQALLARKQAETMNLQLQILQTITDTALSHLSLNDLFREILSRMNEILTVDTIAILLLTEDGKYLTVRAAKGLEEEINQDVRVPVGRGFAGQIAVQRQPLVVPDVSQIEVVSQVLRENVHSLLGVPLLVDDRVIGVLHIGTKQPRLFTDSDVELLQRVADRIARAIDYASLYQAELEARAQAIAHAQQLEAINEQLQQASTMQRTFVSIIGHELRTPLTTIQGFSELLGEGEWSMAEIKEFAVDMAQDAQRLNRIITELLDLERMKSGRMSLNRETVQLNALLTKAITRAQAGTRKHTFIMQLDEHISQVQADKDKLTQVITNLLSNAIKYSPAGGEILVTSQLEDEHIHIQVQDHGIGMSAEALEKLFTPFYRVETTTTRYIQGTGLGLPIVKEIIEMHQGNVWTESTLGEGSTFHFSFPHNYTCS